MCRYTIITFVCGHTLTEIRPTFGSCPPSDNCPAGPNNPPQVIAASSYCDDCTVTRQLPKGYYPSGQYAQPRGRSQSRPCHSQYENLHGDTHCHGAGNSRPREDQPSKYHHHHFHHHYSQQQQQRPEEHRKQERAPEYGRDRPQKTSESQYKKPEPKPSRQASPPPPPPPPPTGVSKIVSDPYTVLEIPRDADGAAVKKAYRKFILTCHPDKVRDESKKAAAVKRFLEVQEAYELLSDSGRRQKYDKGV